MSAHAGTALLADKEYHHTLENTLHSTMIMHVKERIIAAGKSKS